MVTKLLIVKPGFLNKKNWIETESMHMKMKIDEAKGLY